MKEHPPYGNSAAVPAYRECSFPTDGYGNHIFKIIEDQLRRIILIRLDFVNDHFRLLFYFMLRESRMEYNISEQFEGTFQMPGQEGGIDNRLLFIRIGIQIAAHIFHAVKDMPRFSLLRPFKNKMFHEMSIPAHPQPHRAFRHRSQNHNKLLLRGSVHG